MKIGLVLANTPGYSETFFTSKIKGLQENGFEVLLFTQNVSKEFSLCKVYKAPKVYSKFKAIQLLLIFWTLITRIPYLRTILRYIKLEKKEKTTWPQLIKKIYLNSHILKHKLDWLHFGFATQTIGSELVAKAIKAKMAVSFRGFDIAIYPLKHPNCYPLLWEQVDKIHTISNDLLSIAYRLGLPKSVEIQKITPAINTLIFKSEKKIFQIPSTKTKMVSVARLNWKKGFIEVIKALKIVKEKKIDFEYTIVGEGEEYERIAYAVYQLGLEKQVKFVGKKSRSEVVNIYAQSHIFIQYSISEGFCNAALEAQSMGLLCIVSNAEGLSENILNNKTGWIVPKYNYPALVNKIIEVINLPENEKQIISSQAKERIKNNFSIEKQQQEFITFYSK